MTGAGSDPRATAACPAAAKRVPFHKNKEESEFQVKAAMWHMINKPRKKHHVNVGLLPRADTIKAARRRALNLAK